MDPNAFSRLDYAHYLRWQEQQTKANKSGAVAEESSEVKRITSWLQSEDVRERMFERSMEAHTSLLKTFPKNARVAYLETAINDCYAVNNEEACKMFMCAPQDFVEQREQIKRVVKELFENPNSKSHGGVAVRGRYPHWGLLWGYVLLRWDEKGDEKIKASEMLFSIM